MKKYKQLLICLAVMIVISALGLGIYFSDHTAVPMSYNEFLASVDQGIVTIVTFSPEDDYLEVRKKDDDTNYKVPNPRTEDFTEFLLTNNVDIRRGMVAEASGPLQFLAIVGIAGAVFYFFRKNKKGLLIEDSGLQAAYTLADIAGNAEAKAMVEDIISFIKTPERYVLMGAKMPRGILFYGPPGTGKTLMAKAIAGEAKVPFYAMSGSDFVQTYVGVGAGRVRDLFKKARKNEKAVIFIDEIDAIGKKRGNNPSASNDERDQTLNALLTEMSGFHEREGIVVIAATNRVDTLDEALTRPGRFDRQVEIGLPDINARENILKLHGKSKCLSKAVSLREVAKSTVYFSGAMLENLLNEAAIIAVNENESEIRPAHIDKAFTTIIAGAEKTDRSYITAQERKITAFHEAGHALMTKLLLPQHYISKVTIIPSVRGAGGYSLSIPKDTLFLTKSSLEANIQVLFAGRISEELVFGSDYITTGAGNDIAKASNLLVDYIGKYGMNKELGVFYLSNYESVQDPKFLEKCRDLSKELYEEAKALMVQNFDLLKALADQLLQN